MTIISIERRDSLIREYEQFIKDYSSILETEGIRTSQSNHAYEEKKRCEGIVIGLKMLTDNY